MARIFTGYLLMFFDLNINGFDLLPDFLGYIFIVLGAGELEHKSDKFSTGKSWATVMTIYSLISIWMNMMQFNIFFVEIAATIASIYVTYCVVSGIGDIEENEGINMDAKSLRSLWQVEAIMRIICVGLGFFSFSDMEVIIIIVSLGEFIVYIMFLVALSKAKNIYNSASKSDVSEHVDMED
ncbi:MAG: hypothetical protein IJB96_00290 [Lachnospira sp.]|nr:hypothetical protein [Lachnospira sp.]